MWTRDGISNKWPAVRAVGPTVSVDLAENFIWRTDAALQYPQYFCNDHQFETNLRNWLGFPIREEDGLNGFQEKMDEWQDTLRRRRQIPHLNHFASHWVGSSYVFGPHGLVHPNGEVRLAQNFGKWPSVEEIEVELGILARNFKWLKFTMALWDNQDEAAAVERGDQPDMAWSFGDGTWKRIQARGVFDNIPIPAPPPLDQAMAAIIVGNSRETTWPFEMLKEKFKDRIEI